MSAAYRARPVRRLLRSAVVALLAGATSAGVWGAPVVAADEPAPISYVVPDGWALSGRIPVTVTVRAPDHPVTHVIMEGALVGRLDLGACDQPVCTFEHVIETVPAQADPFASPMTPDGSYDTKIYAVDGAGTVVAATWWTTVIRNPSPQLGWLSANTPPPARADWSVKVRAVNPADPPFAVGLPVVSAPVEIRYRVVAENDPDNQGRTPHVVAADQAALYGVGQELPISLAGLLPGTYALHLWLVDAQGATSGSWVIYVTRLPDTVPVGVSLLGSAEADGHLTASISVGALVEGEPTPERVAVSVDGAASYQALPAMPFPTSVRAYPLQHPALVPLQSIASDGPGGLARTHRLTLQLLDAQQHPVGAARSLTVKTWGGPIHRWKVPTDVRVGDRVRVVVSNQTLQPELLSGCMMSLDSTTDFYGYPCSQDGVLGFIPTHAGIYTLHNVTGSTLSYAQYWSTYRVLVLPRTGAAGQPRLVPTASGVRGRRTPVRPARWLQPR